jgi:caspase domain-containing protein
MWHARSCILIAFFLTQFLTELRAQIPNLTGHWTGSAEVPFSQDAIIEYTFKQRGTILEGYSTAIDMNHKDSSKVFFSGTIKSKSIEIRQIKHVYKTGTGCLANLKLVYSNTNGQETLIGKWSGSLGMNTCPPGTGGKVELYKVSSTPSQSSGPVAIRDMDNTVSTEAHTTYGGTLYDELKKRNYYALLIGIETYQDEAIQDLDEPVSDVEKLNSILQEGYTFSEDQTVILRNPTRDEIIDAFDDLTEKVTSKDQLLVFYAGHGIWDGKMKQGYWLPADAHRDSKSRWLSNSTIRDYIGGINSKHTLLITDACFSGSIFKERSVAPENRAILERYKLASRKAMTSGALKTVPDKSVFVAYMIKNLVSNQQAMISAEDLFQTFKTAVINNSTNGQVPQYGAIGQVGDEGGDFIFLREAGE